MIRFLLRLLLFLGFVFCVGMTFVYFMDGNVEDGLCGLVAAALFFFGFKALKRKNYVEEDEVYEETQPQSQSGVGQWMLSKAFDHMNKRGERKHSSDVWLENKRNEINANFIDYRTNMGIYNNMIKEAESLKRQANSARGFERKELLRQAEDLERDAKKYYRSLL